MPQSNAERQRLWRERQKQAGYRAMVVWLPQEAVDILTNYSEKARGHVILNALRNVTGNSPGNTPVTLQDNADDQLDALELKIDKLTEAVLALVNSNTPVTIPGNTPVTIPGNTPVTIPGNTPVTLHSNTARALAVEAQALHEAGLSFARIAQRWTEADVPTLKGGRWHKGTVAKLIQRHAK